MLWCFHQPSYTLVFYLETSVDQRGYCFRLGTRWEDMWNRPTASSKSCGARNPLRLGVLHRKRWEKHLTNEQKHSFIHSINVNTATTVGQALYLRDIEQSPPLLSCSKGKKRRKFIISVHYEKSRQEKEDCSLNEKAVAGVQEGWRIWVVSWPATQRPILAWCLTEAERPFIRLTHVKRSLRCVSLWADTLSSRVLWRTALKLNMAF